MGYNTWPLMDGALIPRGLDAIDPFWKNLFENTLTVQFIHRMIAYAVVLYVGWLLWRQSKRGGFGGVHGWLPRISLLILLQVGLGIATLLSMVADLAGAGAPGPGLHARRTGDGVSRGHHGAAGLTPPSPTLITPRMFGNIPAGGDIVVFQWLNMWYHNTNSVRH